MELQRRANPRSWLPRRCDGRYAVFQTANNTAVIVLALGIVLGGRRLAAGAGRHAPVGR